MSTCFIGEIRLFAFSKVPTGWAPCDGQLLSVASNPQLFAIIGQVYGGDGVTNFGLPNLQGRLPIGFGQAPNLPNYALAATGGSETVTLTEATIPAHSHALTATTSASTSWAPGPTVVPGSIVPETTKRYQAPPASPAWNTLAGESIAATGGGGAHNNVMPSVGLCYFIALAGEFPMHQ